MLRIIKSGERYFGFQGQKRHRTNQIRLKNSKIYWKGVRGVRKEQQARWKVKKFGGGTVCWNEFYAEISNLPQIQEILPEDGFRLLVAGECPVGERFLVLEASAVEAEVNFLAFRLIRWGPTMASNEVSHCWKATSLSAW